MGLQYVVQAILARALGVNAFGAYTYSVTWARLTANLCQLGGPSSALRLVPQYSVQERWSDVAGVLRRFRQVPFWLGVLVAAAASSLIVVVGGTDSSTAALVAALSLAPLAALIEVQVSLARAFERLFRAFFPWLVLQPLVLMAGVGAALALGAELTAVDAIAITAISYVFVMAVQAWVLRRSVPRKVQEASPTFAVREWAHVSLPIYLSNVVQLTFSRLDVVMVGLLKSPRDAGIYAVAMRVGGLASILQAGMASVVAPRISRLHWSGRQHDRGKVEHLVLTAVRWTFLPSLVLTALLCGLAGPILEVFGPAFEAGRTVLVLIALGQLVSVGSGLVGWLMNMTGQQRMSAAVFGGTAVLTIVGYLVLIPWLGINGAAIANGGAVVVRSLVLNVVVRRRLGARISVWRALRMGR